MTKISIIKMVTGHMTDDNEMSVEMLNEPIFSYSILFSENFETNCPLKTFSKNHNLKIMT